MYIKARLSPLTPDERLSVNEFFMSKLSAGEQAVRSADWLAAALDLQSEIYGGKLNLREVPTEAFVLWYQWRLVTKPNTETGIPLKDFDLESVMMFFEDDVKAANIRS